MAKVATKSIEGTTVTWEFPSTGEKISQDLAALPDEIKTRLALHGLSQKGGDSYAGLGSEIEKAAEALKRVLADLTAGNWAAARASGGGGGPRVTLLARAIVRAMTDAGRSDVPEIADIVESLSEMDDETKKALRADSAVKKAMATIKYEDALAKQDEESDGPSALDAF